MRAALYASLDADLNEVRTAYAAFQKKIIEFGEKNPDVLPSIELFYKQDGAAILEEWLLKESNERIISWIEFDVNLRDREIREGR